MTPNLLRPSEQYLSSLESSAGRNCHLGQHQENPLSLLGQYSDDDLGEEESQETKNAIASESTASGCASEQVVDFLADLQNHGLLDDNSDKTKGIAEDNINIECKSSDLVNSVYTVLEETAKEETVVNNNTEAPAFVINDSHTSNILDLPIVQKQSLKSTENEWKAVMHEESGQYYYWNIRTGETTWVIPSALVEEVTTVLEDTVLLKLESSQDIHLGCNDGITEEEPGVPGVQEEPISSSMHLQASEVSASAYFAKEQEEMSEFKTANHLEEQVKDANGEAQQNQPKVELNDAPCLIHESRLENAGMSNSMVSEQTINVDSVIDEMKISGVGVIETTKESEGNQELPALKEDIHEQRLNPSDLLKWSETLSQRFKALEGTNDSGRAPTLQLRYAVEAEMRFADCKALCLCESSLEPYWLHVQTQLKRLESVLCVEEAAISSLKSRSASESVSNGSGMYEEGKILEPVKDEYHETLPKVEQCMASPMDDHMSSEDDGHEDNGHVVSSQNEEHIHSPEYQTNKGTPDPPVHISNDTSNDLEDGEIRQLDDFNVTKITACVSLSPQKTDELPLKVEACTSFERIVENSDVACEDVDMEVDMEVDDQTGIEASVKEEAGLSTIDSQAVETVTFDPSLPSVTPVVSTSSGSLFPIPVGDNEWGVPPQPPEEEWAPPPPPDSDSIPPPPPDEPPPSPSPPLAPSNGYEEPLCPVLTYTEQYTSAYVPLANYNYYPSASTASDNPNYYCSVDIQTDGTQLPYYNQTANAYADHLSLTNPVEGAIYYESSSIAVPESVELNNPEYSSYYENVDTSTYYGISGVTPDVTQVSSGIITAVASTSLSALSTAEVPSSQVLTCVASSSTVSTALVPSIAGGTAGVKGHSKDVRSKKRSIAAVPTLRSNKKVSSLVDKWKAAKEELHGSDDEDENEKALEVLEKKRQREIEEWRMQQIASGEAQDNANFQPLGGDWRERVKRRKTQNSSDKLKSETASVNAESNGVVEGKKPNLAELSKDLPSGWQAFWDESSGEVYYGNLTTSETTWDRPK
ncbi:uncharacterized protein LOC131044633 isoform X2 [Cryptomeria japonica]|uniref:uncharacterized protein LOC131044633 isoform X2 n=1 Tax=Cryptomeria japonica TaxID=3369 RepID=UPI0025ACF182|nr:uncharacterized protein LOC131044633 isoform X2 [Cryptomeria japonica]